MMLPLTCAKAPHFSAVDLRGAERGKQAPALHPQGFAHGFVTLTDDCELQYKADNYYAPEPTAPFAYNDPQIGVEWGAENPVLSAKDAAARPHGGTGHRFLGGAYLHEAAGHQPDRSYL